MSKATIDDVASLAGVSIKTVSRVVNREPNVRESTRDRVEEAIGRLNYRPNISARNLASHYSHLIALLYDDPTAYEAPSAGYVIRMQQGTLQACATAGHELLIHPCNYRDRNVGAELTKLIERTRPDGVIIAAPLSNMPRIVKPVASMNVRYVRISSGTNHAGEYAVATNDREVAAETTRYLASLGHRRIAFITGHSKHKAVANRYKGYRDGLQQADLAFVEELVAVGDNSIGSGEAAARSLLGKPRSPTAIFAANDDMAAGVLRVAHRMGVHIPGQLSVVGFDDTVLAQQICPALTTVRQPLTEMAERAATKLISCRAGGELEPGTEIIPASLQVRESTGPAPD